MAPVGRASTFVGVAVIAVVGVLGLSGCGDDEEEPVAVTQEEWDAEAARLCDQHGPVLAAAYTETQPDSDADEAAFYETDVVPRGRALARGLDRFGYPPDKADQYRASLNEAIVVLQQLDDDPYGYIDQRHNRELTPEEDLMNRLRAAFAGADVPC